MSIYSVKGKGWRYDFTLNGTRHTETWFKTKTEAKKAEATRKEELNNPVVQTLSPTDMVFLELVNKRLDFVKAYKSAKYYVDHHYLAKRWVRLWGKMACSKITTDMVQHFIISRAKGSANTANSDLRYLKAVFNFGIKRKWITSNPAQGIDFLPIDKKLKYVPPKEDVLKVLLAADIETKDYLYAIKETMARVSEINNLIWADVSLEERYVVLYTRKKKGGSRTPRKVPMTDRLFNILSRKYTARDQDKPWVFWHQHWDKKQKCWVEGPFKERTRIMKSLCKKAKVRYFRFHALRHFGASVLDNAHVNIGSIQRILGHENRTTTEIYLHSIGESEREAMRIYECEMEKSHTESHTEIKSA